jgi:riboflavin synthase alpha subunit
VIESVVDQVKSMKTTIFSVELIDAIIPNVNINNTKVYLHVNIELMKLTKKKDFSHLIKRHQFEPGSSNDKI